VLCILVAVAYFIYSGPFVPLIMYFVVGMCRMKLVFEINYEGRFERKCGCIYVGGQMDVHLEHVDLNNMTFA